MNSQQSTQSAGEIPVTNQPTRSTKASTWYTVRSCKNLVQHTPTGTYYARVKADGKMLRKSLATTVLTTAKALLAGKIEELKSPKAELGTFKAARLLYESELQNDYTLAEASRQYRKARIAALLKSWPGKLDDMKLEKISKTTCQEWAKGFAEQFDEQNFNNTLGTLRAIIERGGIGHDANPAFKIKRLGVKPTALHLPEPEQFDRMVEAIENAGSGFSHDCADLVRFLAFSGCRISEANQVTWGDVDMERGEIKVHNAKRSRTSNAHPTRQVPIIPAMRQLLERMQREQKPKPTDSVCKVRECERALTAACGIKNGERLKRTKRGKEILLGIGIERITHHDLRHLFATRCIESGVDVPTVSRWLGHVDGGALAMKVYGHLRRTHSQQAAQLVTFGASPLPENAIPMPKAVAVAP